MTHFLAEHPVLHIARIVLETKTPLAVSSGQTNHVFDSDLVRDASGLPMIPGTAIAGVMRHLFQQLHGTGIDRSKMENIFGFQQGDDGRASRLEVSSGVIHNSRNHPASAHDLCKDELLKFAFDTRNTPAIRERVAIDQRGAAKDTGKFDRTVLPAGYRFSIELVLHDVQVSESHWESLLALLHHPLFRLGASTRSGLGAMQVVRLATASWDLRTPTDAAKYRALRSDIGDITGLEIRHAANAYNKNDQLTAYPISLTPIAGWRFGQGLQSLSEGSDKPADLLPRVETRVGWQESTGKMGKPEIVIPAASIKGVLRHRAHFHACRLAGALMKVEGGDLVQDSTYTAALKRAKDAMKALFGDAGDHSGDTDTGLAGNIIINDLYLPVPPQNNIAVQMHNAIDRFSGGVRNRMLFSEELLFDISIPTFTIWLHEARLRKRLKDIEGFADLAIHAFNQARKDLNEGRLGLGGGTSKGHGYFRDQPENHTSTL